MADDRIDEAIAAVARAVDRIEAATRGVRDAPPDARRRPANHDDTGAVDHPTSGRQTPPLPDVRQPRKPPPPAFTAADLRGAGGFAARPTTSLGQPQPPAEEPVDPLEFDEPEALAPEFDTGDQPSHDLWHEETFYEPEPAFEVPVPPVPAPEQATPQAPMPAQGEPQPEQPAAVAPPAPPLTVPPLAQPVPSYDALSPTGADEVHELVGRIIARTQHLEDQLELARHLRFEITELVRRLAAAVERDR